eukprot:scaffold69595_cov72-Phaeocystis_antarctica.AAC.4
MYVIALADARRAKRAVLKLTSSRYRSPGPWLLVPSASLLGLPAPRRHGIQGQAGADRRRRRDDAVGGVQHRDVVEALGCQVPIHVAHVPEPVVRERPGDGKLRRHDKHRKRCDATLHNVARALAATD